jgi:GTP-binding protein Era
MSNLSNLSKELNESPTWCGYVAIMGRPNVGKSTLLNRILGQKLSITSRKPQTTRHQMLGVKTLGDHQAIFVDTPGIHIDEKHALNKYMNKAARKALRDVNVVIFVVDSTRWTEEDQLVFELLSHLTCPIILAVNKVDTIAEKDVLLPYMKDLSKKGIFSDIMPISATRGTNIEALEKKVFSLLPESPHFFPDNQITDKTMRFRVAEVIREKLTRMLGKEIPYSITIEIESFKDEERLCTIHAVILVERDGQKPIVIGKKGERLKEIGIRSRVDLEQMLNKQVHLKLWVKVKGSWSDDERALTSLGYLDF